VQAKSKASKSRTKTNTKKLKVGDIVIGKDQSYRRSLYRILKFGNKGEFDLLFMCLDGRLGRSKDISLGRRTMDFRHATQKEIYENLGFALTVHLINIVSRLLSTRVSYLERL
jgi:hypothetical protein